VSLRMVLSFYICYMLHAYAKTYVLIYAEGAEDGACAKTHVLMCRKRERVTVPVQKHVLI